ncbi:uncharacterized protein LOC115897026 [Rhinopithecus roxellana]|uniref:uncharacterized protein LOC115897026 n=1 Tax=Rhinopithecus roxellana TaxID=61622 RepID=UPI0012379CB6|nr:uncharacterized protein LOC115897026 [Rhinopithecus roxellana]
MTSGFSYIEDSMFQFWELLSPGPFIVIPNTQHDAERTVSAPPPPPQLVGLSAERAPVGITGGKRGTRAQPQTGRGGHRAPGWPSLGRWDLRPPRGDGAGGSISCPPGPRGSRRIPAASSRAPRSLPRTADSLARPPRLPGAGRVTSPIHRARLPPFAGAGRAVALTTQTPARRMTSSWSSPASLRAHSLACAGLHSAGISCFKTAALLEESPQLTTKQNPPGG